MSPIRGALSRGLIIVLAGVLASSTLSSQVALADPGQPPVSGARPLPPAGPAKPLDPRVGRPQNNGVQTGVNHVGVAPPRRQIRLAPAAFGTLGALITNNTVTAVFARQWMNVGVELAAPTTAAEYAYATLKSPVGCLEAVTGHYRLIGDVTRHVIGFYDFCGQAWKAAVELTPDQQLKYVNAGYVSIEVYKSGATWWGIAYNWQAATWDYLASATTESTDNGWTLFEQSGLREFTSSDVVYDEG